MDSSQVLMNIIGESGQGQLNVTGLLINILIALALGVIIAVTYLSTSSARRKSVSQLLIFLPAIITMVLISLKMSVPAAFGLFAALSIIRFRTPIKDVTEILFIFFSISSGVAIGVNSIAFACMGTTLLAGFLFVINRFGIFVNESDRYTLHLYFEGFNSKSTEEKILTVLAPTVPNYQLLSLESNSSDLLHFSYTLKIKDPSLASELVGRLKEIGASDVLIQHPYSIHE
jgi:uncharacterized membrane protein YhiD involved in acid resistance